MNPHAFWALASKASMSAIPSRERRIYFVEHFGEALHLFLIVGVTRMRAPLGVRPLNRAIVASMEGAFAQIALSTDRES